MNMTPVDFIFPIAHHHSLFSSSHTRTHTQVGITVRIYGLPISESTDASCQPGVAQQPDKDHRQHCRRRNYSKRSATHAIGSYLNSFGKQNHIVRHQQSIRIRHQHRIWNIEKGGDPQPITSKTTTQTTKQLTSAQIDFVSQFLVLWR